MQRHHLDPVQTICTSLQADNHTNTSSLNFSGLMLFLTPKQQCQNTRGNRNYILIAVRMCYSLKQKFRHTHTHIPFNGPFSGTTRVSRYQKGKTDLDFTEARDSTDNHANTPPLSFLQARCPSCRPTNSVKALKALKFRQWRNIRLESHTKKLYKSVLGSSKN